MMLKIFRGLVLGLVVLVGSAYVTPTYASSTSVIITQVRPADGLSALNETVNLYNPTAEPIDITNWCLMNKAGKMFACFKGLATGEHIYIQPYSHAVAVSETESKRLDPWHYTVVYSPTHAGNGSIVYSSDYIALIDAGGEIVDSFEWSKPVYSGGFFWQRSAVIDGDTIDYYNIDPPADGTPLWYQTILSHIPGDVSSPLYRPLPVVAFALPANDESDDSGNDGVDDDSDISGGVNLRLSELLPNPAGVDKDNEYIELWNPGSSELSTDGYSLHVTGGKSAQTYRLPEVTIGPGEYFAVRNTELTFSLNNTAGTVRLIYDGIVLEEVSYQKPSDGLAWALVDTGWVYTNNLTPGEANTGSIIALPDESSDDEGGSVSTSLKPCAANQYRHPETNRCRLLVSGEPKAPTPCKEGQERNPETNRCRNVVASESSPAPCKEGQERNPDTGRCRNIKTVTKLDHGVLGVESEQSGDVSPWLIAGLIGLGLISYGVYEWRSEVVGAIRKIRARFARGRK